jgi:asparagine synthase (glutamine-hydrolysing)
MKDRLERLLAPPKAFLAVSVAPSTRSVPDVDHAKSLLADPAPKRLSDVDLRVWFAHLDAADLVDEHAGSCLVLLSREPRSGDADLDLSATARILRPDRLLSPELDDLLPPFAAICRAGSGAPFVATVDPVGFRHLYCHQADGWAAVSSSARALAVCVSSGLDLAAIGAHSLLGFHVGLATPFAQVTKVPPASIVTLSGGRAVIRHYERRLSVTAAPALDVAVTTAAQGLRTYLSAYLDDHPDAVLQLSGGQDTRTLLGAIPPVRRRGLEAVTLAIPGSPDLEIAARLAECYHMVHHILDFAGLDTLDPSEAHRFTMAASRRLECGGDPLAVASLGWAEAQMEQGRRLSGVGGEVARGFYYAGQRAGVCVSSRRVHQLARWRLFANDAVAPEALEPAFAASARETTLRRLNEIFAAYDTDWLTATDEFYLGQRIHRWAGLLASATCTDRTSINPMLNRDFLDLTRSLPPRFKRGSLFLSRVLCELDADLARIPLDGRPAPTAYASGGLQSYIRLAPTIGTKTAGKVKQRLFGTRRPPAGGELLAGKLVEHWRHWPDSLDPVRRLSVFRESWLDDLLSGQAVASPASAALLINLEAASADLTGQVHAGGS